jgi:hypothetical protein
MHHASVSNHHQPSSAIKHQQSANLHKIAQHSAPAGLQNEPFRPQKRNASASNFIPKTAFGI